jgi:uncharacterized pyridoxal phosphate-containing UPF0001 family protein
MAMAGLSSGRDEIRRQFGQLRQLRDQLRRQYPQVSAFQELSMGMSDDFEIAIEEGATIVRIGSAFLEGSDR